MKISSSGTKVIFERLPDQEVTASGIILPNQGVRRTCRGRVISAPTQVPLEGLLGDTGLKPDSVIIILSKGIDKIDQLGKAEIYWCEFDSIIGIVHEN